MDFYIVLGLERGANLSDIKRAYKRLARRFHPDINPGDRMAAAQFRQIAEAYETLSDPHNFVLEMWATYGIFALLGLLVALGGFFWLVLRLRRLAP